MTLLLKVMFLTVSGMSKEQLGCQMQERGMIGLLFRGSVCRPNAIRLFSVFAHNPIPAVSAPS